MARVAFDVDEKVKREIKVRLAEEGRTLSEVMRAFCLHYKNFGLSIVSSDTGGYSQEDNRLFTTVLYLDEGSTKNLNNLSMTTGKTRSSVVSLLLEMSGIGKEGEIELDEDGNEISQGD